MPGVAIFGTIHYGCVGDDPFRTLHNVFNGDVDGDGRTEIVMENLEGTTYGVHMGLQGLTKVPLNLPGHDNLIGTQLLDFNGDGLKDVVRRVRDQPDELWQNTGNGFIKVPLTIGTTPGGTPNLIGGTIADLNGDGRDDAYFRSCNPNFAQAPLAVISDGFGGFMPVLMTDVPETAVYADLVRHLSHCDHTLMDVNGDGQADIVQVNPNAPNLQVYFRDKLRPDRITSIRDGLGATVSISYGQFDGTASGSCAWPTACAGRNVDIVSAYTVDNGRVLTGQPATTRYVMSYSGPKADAPSGDWLGFEFVQRQNAQTFTRDTKTFDLATRIGGWYPYVGLPTNESIEYTLSSNGAKILRSRSITYKTMQTHAGDQFGPYFVGPETITEKEFERSAQGNYGAPQRWSLQTFTYDDFGNIRVHDTVGMISGTHDVEEIVVANDADSWLLGKLDTITRTSTSATGETDQRIMTFGVDASTGTISTKTVQPEDPLQIVTAYGRNADGMIRSVTETDASGDFQDDQCQLRSGRGNVAGHSHECARPDHPHRLPQRTWRLGRVHRCQRRRDADAV